MLIEAPYKKGDIVTIKLMSGEELVGRFEKEDDKQIQLHYPLTLVASEKGIGLQQFLFTAEVNRSYTVKHTAILCVYLLQNSLLKHTKNKHHQSSKHLQD